MVGNSEYTTVIEKTLKHKIRVKENLRRTIHKGVVDLHPKSYI